MNNIARGERGGKDTRIAFPAMTRDRYLALGHQIAWVFVDEQDRQDFLQGWNRFAPSELLPEPGVGEEMPVLQQALWSEEQA